ncbi:hypothetical protein [Brevundimonas naejangsanensis]|uniref:hypothetical protein n=1 Tax=Brevundimonas naejangsanensis TaxID=588932 RepID=UPI003D182724
MRPLGSGLRRSPIGLLVSLAWLAVGCPAHAGAWNLPKGQGQAIVKYETIRADQAFSPDGERVDLSHDRLDRALSIFAEYGLDDRFTLQMKSEWQEGRDAFVDYQGRGPIEIGVRWQAYRDTRNAAALYVGYAHGGEGRNAGYAPPGAGDHDWEARVMAGRGLGADGQGGFIEAQAARLWRAGLNDETRLDLTAGLYLAPDWLLLGQAYAGAADDGGPRWLTLESSVVRRLGDWSLQAGWRTAVAGRETPAGQGPVIGIWRRF